MKKILFPLIIGITVLFGCEEEEKKDLKLSPIPKFIIENEDTNFITNKTIIHFKDISENNPTSWEWDFGDSTTSYIQNPTHLYKKFGTYKIKLKVNKQFNSSSQTITISNETSSIIDPRDGKEYKTVLIGEQWWMAENLNFESELSQFRDNNEENGEIYGRLYFWSEAQNVCPDGWHLPSIDEWDLLIDYAGSEYNIVNELVSSSTLWDSDFRGQMDQAFLHYPEVQVIYMILISILVFGQAIFIQTLILQMLPYQL